MTMNGTLRIRPQRTHLYALRIDKRTWWRGGGPRDSRYFRRQRRNGGWQYFVLFD